MAQVVRQMYLPCPWAINFRRPDSAQYATLDLLRMSDGSPFALRVSAARPGGARVCRDIDVSATAGRREEAQRSCQYVQCAGLSVVSPARRYEADNSADTGTG